MTSAPPPSVPKEAAQTGTEAEPHFFSLRNVPWWIGALLTVVVAVLALLHQQP